jgi:hypothetical protein
LHAACSEATSWRCAAISARQDAVCQRYCRRPRYTGEVTSPTFTLIHEYLGARVPLYHFDFYRLETEIEALQLGLEEYLNGDGVLRDRMGGEVFRAAPGPYPMV